MAIMGVWRVGWGCAITRGSVRSRAMVSATRDAARRLACSADSVERTAANITSQ
jgi:hypothetical protein